jgi:hypothetical protein
MRAASSPSKPSRQWPGTPARASFRPFRSFLATFRNIAAAALEARIVAVTAIEKAVVRARQDPRPSLRSAASLYYSQAEMIPLTWIKAACFARSPFHRRNPTDGMAAGL